MTFTIAQAAQRCGLTAHTLRYYDREGLLPFVSRSHSGIRIFKEEDFEWLTVITCLKDTGMHVKDIKTFIDWCLQGDDTIEQRLNLFTEQRKKVEAQLKDLKRHLKKIDYKIWYYQTAKEAGSVNVHKEIDKDCLKSETNLQKQKAA